MSREWRFYLNDMIDFAQRVLEYTDGYTQAEFEQNRHTYIPQLLDDLRQLK
ncbi:hypothetical protein L3556_12660 [Candidatus Synechococcus calcipolaris G9]|uniref:Nucleotidyltransferase n=1 Tax=Candidatus Synechococcus calcipolaris G9 TaxID=1497997 RepID=A0ABT6F1Q6_9SYNE|nr:hypothetical protein [Candidatus Synechococcus calcipolaris]MDG2991774.1 hypothetical protein [Candidatus Synechococcus calcipolaris G9]